MLRTIILDPALREQLNGLREQMEVRDEVGKVVGMFLPVDLYKNLFRNTQIPFSEAEIERRMQEQGGCSLDAIWKKLGAK